MSKKGRSSNRTGGGGVLLLPEGNWVLIRCYSYIKRFWGVGGGAVLHHRQKKCMEEKEESRCSKNRRIFNVKKCNL